MYLPSLVKISKKPEVQLDRRERKETMYEVLAKHDGRVHLPGHGIRPEDAAADESVPKARYGGKGGVTRLEIVKAQN